jgi:tetratricopeptide (TPR) repeat protein
MPAYHHRQGELHYSGKQYDLALASYQKALEIDPEYYNAYHGMAYTYRAMGLLDHAIFNYSEVIRLSPDYAQPYKKRAEIYQFIGRIEEAERDLDSFVQYYSNYPAPFIARGDFYMENRDYTRAAEDYATAIEKNPKLQIAYLKHAEALLLSGRLEEASGAFVQAAMLAYNNVTPSDANEIDTIVLTISPSFGLEEEMIDTVTTIYPDEALAALVYEYNFFDMPEYIETGVVDGDFIWITVNLKNGESKRVGGLLADEFGPDDFIIIYDALISH